MSTSGFPKIPLKSIGARDIIKLDYEKSGHLRKEGLLERSLLGRFVQWRQYFVVLRDGCCYVFENDRSSQPKTVFSFENYCRLECFDKSPDYDYCFKLVPRPSCDDLKEHCFAASDEYGRQEWLSAIYKALHVANNLPEPPELDKKIWIEDIFTKLRDKDADKKGDTDDHGETNQRKQKYSKMPSMRSKISFSKADRSPLPPTPVTTHDYDELSEDSDSDTSTETYDDCKIPSKPDAPKPKPRPTCTSVRNRMSQPPTPIIEEEKSKDMIKRHDHNKQDSKRKIEDLPLFKGSSLEAKRILKEKPVGTFLIRTSSQSDSNIPYVLVVSAQTEEVQFRIHLRDSGKIYIKEADNFSCLSELAEHYKKHDLSAASRIRLTNHYADVEYE
uniref:Uncharacterized protein LOC111135709 isoform X1 n=1 Tax=Crassostrea virginica TaxID=6565 RepID=A0A8B8EP58_CRAVI|nr:uncharacterized protein LOC111135709 isoform X1 [Crassostrea virginica]XP_022341711.1 uncharacterized protein LOC111135709 isoform X1 [Crassostrea virginica]